ncbi:helix-turn-helix transcriptional regulator [Nocardia sp. NPDC004582]
MARRGVQHFSSARLRTFRDRAKLTLEDLADMAGVSVATLSALERNVSQPSVATLAAIAKALDIDISQLVPVPESRRMLDHLRVQAGLRQDDVAVALRVSSTVVARMERGRTPVNAERAAQLGALYGVGADVVAQVWQRTNDARAERLRKA